MAGIGPGYGSECHLLRYLGRHRALLDRAVLTATGAAGVEWLDFPFDASRDWGDGEWKGLEFLAPDSPARKAWSEAWPARGNPPNWDAVARIEHDSGPEWLLVEAKANAEELASTCAASDAGGRALIAATLARTKAALGVDAGRDWLAGHYQYANRMAVLHLLVATGEEARLLFIYFTGDRHPTATCPADEAEWESFLGAQAAHIGLPAGHPLADRVHTVFLEARPSQRTAGRPRQ